VKQLEKKEANQGVNACQCAKSIAMHQINPQFIRHGIIAIKVRQRAGSGREGEMRDCGQD
jgi:hypothetical protein